MRVSDAVLPGEQRPHELLPALAQRRRAQSHAQVAASEESLRIAGENLTLSTYSYGEGQATILDVLQAQLSWIQLYMNAIRAHFNYAVAVSDYRRITVQGLEQ